jgi:hypothetical protein
MHLYFATKGPRCGVVVALAVPLLIGAAATQAHGAGELATAMSEGMRCRSEEGRPISREQSFHSAASHREGLRRHSKRAGL